MVAPQFSHRTRSAIGSLRYPNSPAALASNRPGAAPCSASFSCSFSFSFSLAPPLAHGRVGLYGAELDAEVAQPRLELRRSGRGRRDGQVSTVLGEDRRQPLARLDDALE